MKLTEGLIYRGLIKGTNDHISGTDVQFHLAFTPTYLKIDNNEVEISEVEGIFVTFFSNDDETSVQVIVSYDTTNETYEMGVDATQIEFMGTLTEIESERYATELDNLHNWGYIYPVEEMTFYQLDGKMNVVDKSSNLSNTNSTTYYGAFKGEVDILNPTILVEDTTSGGFTWNYVYIPSLSRYYFINGVVCVRDNLYRISCHVDVLYTYKTDILQQTNIFIVRTNYYEDEERYENICNTADDRVNFEDHYSYSYTTSTATGSLVNTTFTTTPSGNSFVACIINNETQLTPSDIDAIGSLSAISSQYFSNPLTYNYIMNYSELLDLINFVKDSSSRQSYVLNILSLPFDVTSVEENSELQNATIKVGSENTGTTYVSGLYGKNNDISNYIIIADFTIPSTYSGLMQWMNFEPYTYHELFLPYYGWIQVAGKDVVGKRIIVYYSLNYQTGDAQVYVKNYTINKIIFTGTCQLGIKIPVSVSNAQENGVARMSNGTNLALGLIGSAVATGVGIATLNPVAIAGGVLSAGHSLATAITGENAIFDRVNGQASSGNSGLYMEQKVIYKRSYKAIHEWSSVVTSAFLTLNGYKVNDYGDISECKGHTEIGMMEYEVFDQINILKPEIDEIVALARDGIIL